MDEVTFFHGVACTESIGGLILRSVDREIYYYSVRFIFVLFIFFPFWVTNLYEKKYGFILVTVLVARNCKWALLFSSLIQTTVGNIFNLFPFFL